MSNPTPSLSMMTPELLERMPLFPLPNAVLFPGTVVPLHLFEPRYRALGDYCIEHERVFALATLAPGYESEYEGKPALRDILCLGEITAERRHPDGRWDIALKGVTRARVVRENLEAQPFRMAQVEILEDVRDPGALRIAERVRAAVVQVTNYLPALWPVLSPQLLEANTPGALADVIAGTFVEDPTLRYLLIRELNDKARLLMVEDVLAQVLVDVSIRASKEMGTKTPRELN